MESIAGRGPMFHNVDMYHVTSFFFDHYSAFTLGVGESFAVADEGAWDPASAQPKAS